MTSSAEYYLSVLEDSGVDGESLTVVVVAGATREQVATALAIDLNRPMTAADDFLMLDHTFWGLVDVPGGVLGVERSGYGDPSPGMLATASQQGRRAAVARSNIQAHVRFGCAGDGELAFDDDEYAFIEDPGQCPAELRSLFDTAWVDLGGDEDDAAEAAWVLVALAMVERWTGIRLTAPDMRRAVEGSLFWARTQVYFE